MLRWLAGQTKIVALNERPIPQYFCHFRSNFGHKITHITHCNIGRLRESAQRIVLARRSFRSPEPIGLTVHDDLRNGAEGVDAIVANDGGNAYRIANYAWLPAGGGATQLVLEFHTLLCELPDEPAESDNVTT